MSAHGGLPPPPAGLDAGRAAHRPDRQVRSDVGRSGGTRSRATGARRCRSRCPTATSSSSNANADPPALVAAPNSVAGVGSTILFNMAVNPQNAKLYVGEPERAERGPLRARILDGATSAQSHITVDHRHDAARRAPEPAHRLRRRPGTPAEVEQSLAFPVDMRVSSDGSDAVRRRASARGRSASSTPRPRGAAPSPTAAGRGRRRAERSRARRGAQPALRDEPHRPHDLGREQR